jgi:Cof subfamily protein (haloacid dehalogenase superfamily)
VKSQKRSFFSLFTFHYSLFTILALPFHAMAIRLIALDLDGTLLTSRGQVSERNRRALEAARRGGARVALVTGRRFRDARPLALELGLDVPLISHNGALTKHARTLENVAVFLLPLAEAHDVLRIGRAHEMDAMVSDDPQGKGLLVYDHMRDDNQPLARYIAWSRRIHGPEADEAVRRVPSLSDYLDHAPVHISFSGTVGQMQALGEKLKCEMDGRVKVFCTVYPKQDFALLDILHPSASKGTGVAATAVEYGLTPDEVMAVGDNFNDLEMLHYAGTAVVMGNADAALHNIAGFHATATNDEDGVALAIERFVLQPSQESGV